MCLGVVFHLIFQGSQRPFTAKPKQASEYQPNENKPPLRLPGLPFRDEGGGDDSDVVQAGNSGIVGHLIVVDPDGYPALAGAPHQ